MEESKYVGKYITVKEQKIDNHTWEKVYLQDGLIVYPFDHLGQILFVKEKRPHENPKFRLKPVTGIYEHEYNFEENVNRELQEEIGYKAAHIEKFMEIRSTGTINNTVYFAYVHGLSASKLPNPDGEDSIQSIFGKKLEDMIGDVHQGHLPWGHYCLGLFKLQHLLKTKGLKKSHQ